MKLKDNLYSIVKKGMLEDKHSFIIVLNPVCSIYTAHFPGMPITPGVCIVQIVEELSEDLLGYPIHLTRIKNAKFLSVLKPEGQEVCITYTSMKIEDKIINLQVLISDLNKNIYAKISLQAAIA